jgi:hypothetical protein
MEPVSLGSVIKADARFHVAEDLITTLVTVFIAARMAPDLINTRVQLVFAEGFGMDKNHFTPLWDRMGAWAPRRLSLDPWGDGECCECSRIGQADEKCRTRFTASARGHLSSQQWASARATRALRPSPGLRHTITAISLAFSHPPSPSPPI